MIEKKELAPLQELIDRLTSIGGGGGGGGGGGSDPITQHSTSIVGAGAISGKILFTFYDSATVKLYPRAYSSLLAQCYRQFIQIKRKGERGK